MCFKYYFQILIFSLVFKASFCQVEVKPKQLECYSFILIFKSISVTNPLAFTGLCELDKSVIDQDSIYDFKISTDQKVTIEKKGNYFSMHFKDTTIIEFIDSINTLEKIVRGRTIAHLIKLPVIKFSKMERLEEFVTTFNQNNGWNLIQSNTELYLSSITDSYIQGRKDLKVSQEIRWIFSKQSKVNDGYEEIIILDSDQTQTLKIFFDKMD